MPEIFLDMTSVENMVKRENCDALDWDVSSVLRECYHGQIIRKNV